MFQQKASFSLGLDPRISAETFGGLKSLNKSCNLLYVKSCGYSSFILSHIHSMYEKVL